MSISRSRSWLRIGIAGGIPLLALALGTGDGDARSIERDIGSGAGQKSTPPRTAAHETRAAEPDQGRPAGARNHDPCCEDEPPVPRARAGAATNGASEAPAAVPPAPAVRDATPGAPEVLPSGTRPVKRALNGRVPPRARPGDQRRGGVGALFGITFA